MTAYFLRDLYIPDQVLLRRFRALVMPLGHSEALLLSLEIGPSAEGLEAGVLRVILNRLLDLEGQGEGGARLLGGDVRGISGSYGLEEGFDFEAERLAGDDGWLVHAEGGQDGGCGVLWFPRLRGET